MTGPGPAAEQAARYAAENAPRHVPRHAPEPVTGGESLVRALAAHGVTHVFGIPGTHNLEIYRHLGAHGIDHTAPRHEQGAGYAADAYSRATGTPGVALTTTGPGLLNIAAAVGQAYSDSVPLLVVSPGMPSNHPVQSTGLLHEARSQTGALSHVAGFSHRVSSVEEIEIAVARAFTYFRTGRPRPAHIEVPLDLLEATYRPGAPRRAPTMAPPAADSAAIERAVRALAGAERPGIVLGGGALAAADDCLALAERLAAPVVTTANGKGVVDEHHPLSLGVSLHSPAVQEWLADRDVLFAVGTELAESDFWSAPPVPRGRVVRLDIDPAQMYTGVPADIPLVGDAGATLPLLVGALPAAPLARTGESARAVADLRARRDAETRTRDLRWTPWLDAIGRVLADDAILTSDSAQCCYYGALPHLRTGARGRFLHPTGFGTLGYALPAAVGAKVAFPGRQVVALSGDGGLQFSVQELATAAQLRLPLPVVVFDNGGYGEIRDEMVARGDTPLAVDHAPVDLSAVARAYGGRGVRVSRVDELAPLLVRALDTTAVTVITIAEERA